MKYEKFLVNESRNSSNGRARVVQFGKPRGQASLLTPEDIIKVEAYIDQHSNAPCSDRLKFRLSVYAGLRAAEIAGLSVSDVILKDGSISPYIQVLPRIAKGGRQRSIPMHAKITSAVQEFINSHPGVDFVSFSHRGSRPKKQSVTAVTNWFWELYSKVGLKGCSSHSGRRTFITTLAQRTDGSNFTLRDVQELAGHSSLAVTERYIGLSKRLEKLVGLLP